MAEKSNELIEIYKLHAELADRVSARRGESARAHVTLLSALCGLLVLAVRIDGGGSVPLWLVTAGISSIALLVAVSWIGLIRSFRQLNHAKFVVLGELEKQLEFEFFGLEWKELGGGRDSKKYRRLTEVERILPYTVAVGCACLLIGSLLCRWP